MYFNNLVETVSTVPNYFLTDILTLKNSIKLTPDERHIIGEGNKIQRFLNADPYIRSAISELTAFVISQQYPFLKNMVSYESGIVAPHSNKAEIKMPTRYIARAGEQIIIPLTGTAMVASTEFNDSHTLSPGFVYRLNNRVGSTFTTSADFLAVFVSLVDFDMKKYLLPHDWHSPYTRKKDEYANSALAPEIVEETPSY